MSQASPDLKAARLARACESLEGLCCGDAFGERFFLPSALARSMIDKKDIPAPPWFYTDDTMMAMSIVATLEKQGEIDSDYRRRVSLRITTRRGVTVPQCINCWSTSGQGWTGKYGHPLCSEGRVLLEMAPRCAWLHWARTSPTSSRPYPSRLPVPPLRRIATPKVAGAVAVSLASGLAFLCGSSRRQRDAREFLERVHSNTPDSEVRDGIRKAMDLAKGTSPEMAVFVLGNGSGITCQDTVPFCLWCAANYLHSYEEALWATVSGLGDRDTTCAIVGGIVVMYAGVESIPKEWIEAREAMPANLAGEKR